VLQRLGGDVSQALGRLIAVLINMEVQGQATLLGQQE
jgi:hypothetical protein